MVLTLFGSTDSINVHLVTEDSTELFFFGFVWDFCLYFYSLVYNCKSGIISHGLCIDSNPDLCFLS